ncbi:PREDICTED: dihydrofolate reductase [Miniopterus natalensis]|uniref:dihydrofolate reductase n=1 Tax=Miniopterus natalensis TaxID=291302 RepID=UPI0007A6AA04|nr:PREDICTED: dihydrofolate reductase [Miniopterus natalensis]
MPSLEHGNRSGVARAQSEGQGTRWQKVGPTSGFRMTQQSALYLSATLETRNEEDEKDRIEREKEAAGCAETRKGFERQRRGWVLVLVGKQNLVITGRKTWFSIPEKNQPLKDRINLALSRKLKEPPKGAHFLAKSLDDALKLIEEPELTNKVDMVWIVGGGSVYKEVMNKSSHLRLFVTRIMQEFESDTFFPDIDLEKYKLLPKYPGILSDVQEEKGIKYKFEVYENE